MIYFSKTKFNSMPTFLKTMQNLAGKILISGKVSDNIYIYLFIYSLTRVPIKYRMKLRSKKRQWQPIIVAPTDTALSAGVVG